MRVTLLFHTPLSVCSHATRTCWQSFEKGNCGGEKDKELIDEWEINSNTLRLWST